MRCVWVFLGGGRREGRGSAGARSHEASQVGPLFRAVEKKNLVLLASRFRTWMGSTPPPFSLRFLWGHRAQDQQGNLCGQQSRHAAKEAIGVVYGWLPGVG